MSTGEVVFGGVGSGLYGMLLFVLLAVFIAGLMVGRTPEYLGKKIEAREVKLVMVGTLFVPLAVLVADRAGGRDEVRRPLDLQPRAAGLLGDALRLRLAGQQQRLGVRGLHRLRPAERARQRGRLRHHLRRPARRPGHAVRPLRPAGRRARGGRRARAPSACRPLGPGTFRTDTATFVVLLIGDDRDRRRPDLLPRLPARPDRAGTDRPALLGHATRPHHLRPGNRGLHGPARARLSAAHHGRRPGGLSRTRPTAARSSATARSSARA